MLGWLQPFKCSIYNNESHHLCQAFDGTKSGNKPGFFILWASPQAIVKTFEFLVYPCSPLAEYTYNRAKHRAYQQQIMVEQGIRQP